MLIAAETASIKEMNTIKSHGFIACSMVIMYVSLKYVIVLKVENVLKGDEKNEPKM